MVRKKSLAIMVIGVFLLLLLCGFSAVQAQPYQMRISTFLSSKDSTGKACQKLGELINTRAKGKIEAKVWTDAQLGNQREHVEMVRDGSLEVITNLATGMGQYVPQLTTFELPYIYKDDAHMVRVLVALRPYVEELVSAYNVKPLGYLDIGFRHMLNKRKPIYTVTDMKGLKFRAPNPVYLAMINALGGSGITVEWPEVYTALQSGVVDGMEASPALIYAMKFQEQAKYLSKTFHIGANFYFMVNKKWFDSLPKDLQAIVAEASEDASKYQVQQEMLLEGEAMDKLTAAGVKVNEVTNLKEFSAKCGTWRDNYVKERGPAFMKLFEMIKAVQ